MTEKENKEYYCNEGLDLLCQLSGAAAYGPLDAINPANTTPFFPDLADLVRLHKTIRQRKVLTALEFGVGFSTLIMADALAKNKKDYEAGIQDLRCLHPFKLFAVDADQDWIEIARRRIPSHLHEHVVISHSEVHIGTFHDRLCHYFSKIPNVCPDFIYLDGPAGHQVQGEIDGSDFATNLERTVMSGDLLRLEPTFVPGLMIIVDGRTNNARFLKNNFQRNWTVTEDSDADITVFELCEAPLGPYNRARLSFHNIL